MIPEVIILHWKTKQSLVFKTPLGMLNYIPKMKLWKAVMYFIWKTKQMFSFRNKEPTQKCMGNLFRSNLSWIKWIQVWVQNLVLLKKTRQSLVFPLYIISSLELNAEKIQKEFKVHSKPSKKLDYLDWKISQSLKKGMKPINRFDFCQYNSLRNSEYINLKSQWFFH